MDSTSFYFDEELQDDVGTAWTTENRQSPVLSRGHVAYQTKPLPALPPSHSPSIPATLPAEFPAELPIYRFFLTEYDPPAPEPKPTKPSNTDLREPPISHSLLTEHDRVCPESTQQVPVDAKEPTNAGLGHPISSIPRLTPNSDFRTSTTLDGSSQDTLAVTEDPKPASVVVDTRPKRSYTAKELKLRTERNTKYFQDSVLTEDRLQILGSRWLNRGLLKNVLSYCKPFTITLCRTHLSSSGGIKTQFLRSDKNLVTIDHHDLFKYLGENDHWNAFADSFSSAWPKRFGCLNDEDSSNPCYLWPSDALITDDEAAIICRKSVPRGQGHQALLESLFRGFNLSVYPQDNMLWQIAPSTSTSVLTMPMVALMEGLFSPTVTARSVDYIGILSDWCPIQNTMPVLYSQGDFAHFEWSCTRFNLRACIPDERGARVKHFKDGYGISPPTIGFPLKRQAARIAGFSGASDQFAIEFLVSVSLVLRYSHSVFKHTVVVWLDYRIDLHGSPVQKSLLSLVPDRVDQELDLKDCGNGGAGVLQFMVILVRCIDYWRKRWDTMMAKIDETISVQLQDTLDRKRWQMLMFDDSFQLSEQYFTVLQLLRIFQGWIEEAEEAMADLRGNLTGQYESWIALRRLNAPEDDLEWPLDMPIMEENWDKVEAFFHGRVNSLKLRIERKKDEVESLRSGLFNASSLREALKAKTLNLLIGVFTVVTVFYTPLGFMAAFWAMPFMTPDKADSPPKGFTTSFTVVPLLTYILATCIVLWIWGISSHYVRDYIELTVRDFASAAVRDLKSAFANVKESRFAKIPRTDRDWTFGIIENWRYSFHRWKNLRPIERSRYDQEAQN
ncbi:hypothetical protein AB5N19_04490 [Seiridium cardinale]